MCDNIDNVIETFLLKRLYIVRGLHNKQMIFKKKNGQHLLTFINIYIIITILCRSTIKIYNNKKIRG